MSKKYDKHIYLTNESHSKLKNLALVEKRTIVSELDCILDLIIKLRQQQGLPISPDDTPVIRSSGGGSGDDPRLDFLHHDEDEERTGDMIREDIKKVEEQLAENAGGDPEFVEKLTRKLQILRVELNLSESA